MVTETTGSKTPGLSRINPRAFLPQDFIKLSLQADCPSPLQDSVSWSLPGHCRHPFAPVRKAGIGCGAVCVCVCVCVCVYSACLTSWVYVACVLCVCVCVCVCVHGHSAASHPGKEGSFHELRQQNAKCGGRARRAGHTGKKRGQCPPGLTASALLAPHAAASARQLLKQKLRESWSRLFLRHSGLGLPAQMASNATRQRTPLPVELRALGTA